MAEKQEQWLIDGEAMDAETKARDDYGEALFARATQLALEANSRTEDGYRIVRREHMDAAIREWTRTYEPKETSK